MAFRGSKMFHRRVSFPVIVILLTFIYCGLNYQTLDSYLVQPMTQLLTNTPIPFPRDLSFYRTLLIGEHVTRTNPTILLYTEFKRYADYNATSLSNICGLDCTLTTDKSLHPLADAVVFQVMDIATWLSFFVAKGAPVSRHFPEYRNPNSVWVLFHDEPASKFHDNFDSFQNIFNWTLSYRRNSDVFVPYGKKIDKEKARDVTEEVGNEPINYFRKKSRSGAAAMITNCYDDARRYRLISDFKRFIDVHVVGLCGEKCPGDHSSCEDVVKEFKFYLAFENSDCYDYVTEKYWRALKWRQIPIVAWKLNMSDLVIPGSYINVYDFDSIDEAGKYIQRVNSDQDLYNSYFNWRTTFSVGIVNPLCELCRKLMDANVPRTIYHDMSNWLTDDVCRPLTSAGIIKRRYDRIKHNMMSM